MIKTNNLLQKDIEASYSKSFVLQFYKKFGYYPTILMKDLIISKIKTNKISLNELKRHFKQFLPKSFEKTINLEDASRKQPITDLRFIYIQIARMMNYTLRNIGISLNRDHTTMMHALNQFKNLYETNESFRIKYQQIINYIKSKYEPSTMDHLDKMEIKPKSDILS